MQHPHLGPFTAGNQGIAQSDQVGGGIERGHVHPNAGEVVVGKVVGSSVHRVAQQQAVTRFEVSQKHRRDGAHAALEHGGLVRVFPDRQSFLQNLQVGVVQAAVDEALYFAFALGFLAVRYGKKVLAGFGIGEGKGGRQKQRGFDRIFTPGRLVAVGHHQGLGVVCSHVSNLGGRKIGVPFISVYLDKFSKKCINFRK